MKRHLKTSRYVCSRIVLGLGLALPLQALLAATPIKVPMTADQWQVSGDVQFVRKEGFPQGLMVLKSPSENGFAALKNLQFSNGTIEYDFKSIVDDMPGIRFRQRDAKTAEEFYVRTEDTCPASLDCLQYAPIFKGRMLWDTYYDYQASAPFREGEWNHIKLVISGRRMNVYVNGAATPSLMIGQLEGDALSGGIQLQGPATFANLTITSDAVEGLASDPTPDPTASDPHYVRRWELAKPEPLPDNKAPQLAQMPTSLSAWTTIDAEREGLINLARQYGPAPTRAVPVVAWLKTNVQSDHAQTKHVAIGYLRVVSVFVNGQLVFSGSNRYNVPGGSKAPDGRIGLENGAFNLPLKKGKNDIAIALSSNTSDMADRYGFGLEFRFDDIKGIHAGG